MFPVTSTSSGTRYAKIIGIGSTNFCPSCHGNKKGGIFNFFLFLLSNFMKHRRNIHRSVWKLLAC